MNCNKLLWILFTVLVGSLVGCGESDKDPARKKTATPNTSTTQGSGSGGPFSPVGSDSDTAGGGNGDAPCQASCGLGSDGGESSGDEALVFNALKLVNAQAYETVPTFKQDALWSVDNAIDGDKNTLFSSRGQFHPENTKGIGIAAWTQMKVSAKALTLHARMHAAKPQGFPSLFAVYVTNPNNTAWEYVGTYNDQLMEGKMTIQLGGREIYGVAINPVTLGADLYGNYYFQLADIELH